MSTYLGTTINQLSHIPISWEEMENVIEYVSCVLTTIDENSKNENQDSRQLLKIIIA